MRENRFHAGTPSPQSLVKIAIIEKYFGAWSGVLTRATSGRICYADLYAGEGQYQDGTPSIPLGVLRIALADRQRRERLVTVFNDRNASVVEALKQNIRGFPGVDRLRYLPVVLNYEVGRDDALVLEELPDVPTLTLLDPTGYAGLSLDLIDRLITGFGCECIIFFNYNQINRWLTAPEQRHRMIALFGREHFDIVRERVRGLSGPEREHVIIQVMKEALRSSGAEFVIEFRFRNEQGSRTSHYIIHTCKHVRGHEKMKEEMHRQSTDMGGEIGSFEFCPAEVGQLRFDDPADYLAPQLVAEFAGRCLPMKQVYEEHHPNTPYVPSHYKRALLELEDEGRIQCDPHRKGTLADHVRVTFPAQGEP